MSVERASLSEPPHASSVSQSTPASPSSAESPNVAAASDTSSNDPAASDEALSDPDASDESLSETVESETALREAAPAAPASAAAASSEPVPAGRPEYGVPEEPVDPLAAVKVRVSEDTVDEDGFVSLWNVAAATVGGRDTQLARTVASKLLGFLCKQRCDFVFTSSADANYLDQWFERDPGLLYDWTPTSEKVDVLSQHAQVPAKALLRLVEDKGFDATKAYSPRRADRVEWFRELWCIG